MSPRPAPRPRRDYRHFRDLGTRWMDNDVYGHVNNVVYYSWFDTAVNAYLVEHGALDPSGGSVVGLVVHTHCDYFEPLAFPQLVQAGVAVAALGRSSIRYRVGLFAQGAALTAAAGEFVHVYVDRQTRQSVRLPEALRTAVAPLVMTEDPTP